MASPERDLDLDPCFGEVASTLAPRGLHAARSSRGGTEADEIAVVFRRGETREVLDLLDELEGPDGAIEGALSPRGVLEIVVRYPRGVWEGIARGSPVAAALRAASDATRAPAGPVRVMGIVNVTPDSFSDGGRFLDADRAVEHGIRLAAEGAEILDVGGESTRPGSEPVPLDVELARVVPVVAGLARATGARISVDTQKAEVARAALDAGASIVNDVSAGRFDPAMLALVAARGADFVAMHMQGTPRDMQACPEYGDVVADVLAFLRERARACLAAGIAREKILIDPGIGFGKTLAYNVEVLRRLPELRSLRLPVCLGVSRKSFLSRLSGSAGTEREAETAAAVAIGVLGGAEILRVHDVARMRAAAKVAESLRE